MNTGIVKWFHEAKGYGLIKPHDRTEDVFVFYSIIAGSGFRTLKTGQEVLFEAMQCIHGRRAISVTPQTI